ncbi:MAG: formate-dependent phosphoribosylglycinamide formyltransferase [Geothrix sp.]|jgi:phosphoribosylglycinamide formyltransferase 2|uniref:Formate-dependent phosphoribosylglycinamide formyltransferase n=1 Tax=Candidatus Geothrix odensensis TaxID=2954440 RepID=A0A936F2K9_9BACT|nr:formate-dependent phosphoribosylglycinamide formyltransferase [Candidatus Geothrix odensensis]MBK8788837.1 formate-dependent phosphoribosylglycinamide formyltransferase [Holophagaceae bacterium]MCC6513820.1 formate-dependent phosphoribosylglycinamide formyltransferase [Geothrix sp.]
MTTLGTPLSPSATRVLLLGSGELGKEVAIELQRLGCEVIACDRYANAPAMQVAHRSHVFSMLDATELRRIVALEQPHLIVPEIEAIATQALLDLEAEGFTVVPSARAANLTMNREGIRRFAAEELGLATSPYRFVSTEAELREAVKVLGLPCVVKPIMSSSGKGQSVIKTEEQIDQAWAYAQEGGRSGAGRCIVEGFIAFDYEITALTVSAVSGIQCCPPIGHIQIDGDYRESWQPMPMSEATWDKAQAIARKVVSGLGGYGIFGVELFIRGEEVIFSEVSPRPHDTGLVTLGSQNMSEFALHARAILGLPVPSIRLVSPAASVPLLGHGDGIPSFHGLEKALEIPDSHLRLFGKPECRGHRRLAVAICAAPSLEAARRNASIMAAAVTIDLQ